MVAPSRRRNNFLLCHFKGIDSSFSQIEIKQSQGPAVQNFSLSVDDDGKDAFVGILVNAGSSSNKKVRILRYVLSDNQLNCDTTYRFKTPDQTKTKEGYFFEQEFIQIPGKGFMYLKEYGKRFFSSYLKEEEELVEEEEPVDPKTKKERMTINRNDYTRYSNLSVGRREFERGDLSLRYFPLKQNDSCWSGLLNIAQSTELNSSYLSYAFLPLNGKIMFLYNTLSNYDNRYSSTTTLDQNGNPLNEGLVFWRSNNVMNFQKARLISKEELAVPFEKNRLQGFAIIRLKNDNAQLD
jgi:hypothetical protein